jgi:hypothetical protein
MERSIKEDTICYASSAQRALLGSIGDIEIIAREFFEEDALPAMKKKLDWSLFERICRNFIDLMYRMQKWS